MSARGFMVGTAKIACILGIVFACALQFTVPAFAEDIVEGNAGLVATTPDVNGNAGDAAVTADVTATRPFTEAGMYNIAAAENNNLVVGMKKNKRINGIPTTLAKRKNTNLLKFKFVSAGEEGLFYIVNVATGRQLAVDVNKVSGSSKYATMLTKKESAYQKWRVDVNDDNTVSITNPKTGLCMSIANGAAAKGSMIRVSAPVGDSSQKFSLVKAKKNKFEIVKIGVPCLKQNPQLPTGCESVALTNALNYWGFHLAKTTIASRWMPYGGNGVYNFIGSPYNSSGWIICAPGIKNTANKFLQRKHSNVKARVVKGKPLKSLRAYLDQGYPVVVWTTIGMGSPGGLSMYRSGYPLRSNNHAVVLTGYNPKTGEYQVSDSLAGRVWRNGSRFTWLYNAMGKQGVVLYN